MRFSAPRREEGIRTHTRPAYEENENVRETITRDQYTLTVDSSLKHKASLRPGDETFKIRPRWALILYTIPRFRTR